MHTISPCDIRLARHVGPLEVAVEYTTSAISPGKMRCAVSFANTNVADSKPSPAPDQPVSWLRHLLSRDETTHLVSTTDIAAHPMLAYVQIIGYARLNHQIGAEGAGDPMQSAYWRDSEYSATYVAPDCDDNVADILHTPFFKASAAANTRTAGFNEIQPAGIDASNYALLRDLVHPYTAIQMPRDSDHVTEAHRAEIAASIARFVMPFYVSAQHLIFSSTKLEPGKTDKYCIECDIPSDIFPPSYNTRSTGSLGDGGLASLAYAFVVGFQEEINGEMKQRAVYFPLEMRAQNVAPDGNWYQHNYLQGVHIDKTWKPRIVSEDGEMPKSHAKTKNDDDIAYATFLADLNVLINDSSANVAARERRKSSVSHDISSQMAQVSTRARTSYQIRVNNTNLCLLTLSSSFYNVGSDIQFFLKNDSGTAGSGGTAHTVPPRVVGYTTYLEAHEIFHLENDRKVVNVYKVTPTLKVNTYAEAIMQDAGDRSGMCNRIHVPGHVTQQFQSSSFMDLRYFLVFRFVLSEFEDKEDVENAGSHTVADYVQAHRVESDGTDFKFSIPITILP